MKTVYTIVLSFLFSLTSKAQIKYVTEYGDGTMDGSSWANAWSGQIFADTIYSVTSGTQVWLRRGTYRPTKDTNGLVPNGSSIYEIQQQTTFKIQSGVKLIGGFEGNETTIDQRVESLMFGPNAVNVTNLNGENEMDYGSYSKHIITMQNVNSSTVVDGFCFYNAYATEVYINSTGNQSADPLIRKCCFYGPGEAMLCDAQGSALSKPVISNCTFIALNSQYNVGGILMKGNVTASISNSIFCLNQGGFSSCIGFVGSHGGSINNCTFNENITDDPNGVGYRAAIGISNVDDSIYINNCIFHHNSWQAGKMTHTKVVNGGNYFSVRNSDFQAQDAPAAYYTEPAVKINCIDEDPQFFSISDYVGPDQCFGTADDGLVTSETSPCRDAGSNDLIPTYLNKDFTDRHRVSECRVDMGVYEFQVPGTNNITLSESSSQTCTQYPVGDTGTVYIDPVTCLTLTKLNPSGANPISGTVKVCVQKDASVQTINGVPYVQRHYNIEPSQNASTATSRITLYYTQQEFDNYNAVAISFPKLPISAADAAGIANIRIEQDHGVSLTGVPGSYTGTTVYIDPVDTDIAWNATSNIWEVSFDVTGFSGFFMTSYIGVLPVTLSGFSAIENNGVVKLNWQTVSEINSKYFDIERSIDGNNFTPVGRVDASGNSNGHTYTFNDNGPMPGLNYYKLGMIDINGSKKYSAVVTVNLKRATDKIEVIISPNPAITKTNIIVSGKIKGKAILSIYDMNGRKVMNLTTGEMSTSSFSTLVDLAKLQRGIYVVEVQVAAEHIRSKLVIQ